MTRIKCSNPKCPRKSKVFDWDKSADVKPGCRISDAPETGAEVLAVACPYCGTENKVWVVCPPGEQGKGSGGGIVSRNQIQYE